MIYILYHCLIRITKYKPIIIKNFSIFFSFILALAALKCMCQSVSSEEFNFLGVDKQNGLLVADNWPVGSVSNTVLLNIPLNYISIPHSNAIPIVEYTRKIGRHSSTYLNRPITIKASLPDLRPSLIEDFDLATNEDKDNEITLYFAPTARSKYKGDELINSLFEDNIPFVLKKWQVEKFNLKFDEKPSRFGLKRMGPVGNFEPFRKIDLVNDIYFTQNNPKNVFIICAAEEIHDAAEDPNWSRRPFCEHRFFHNGLQALAVLTYRRIHLRNWKNIQKLSSDLLNNFQSSK